MEKKACKIKKREGHVFTVEETVEMTVNSGFKITKEQLWTVTWDPTKDNIHCSCNSLVHSGLPCTHIIRVAFDEHFQIPLKCFLDCFFHFRL